MTQHPKLILGFPEYMTQTRKLAEKAGIPFTEVGIHHFPDGESKVTLPETLPDHIVLCRSLDRPNDKLVEIMLAARGARALGASRISLVCPYLCYMRQDKAFHPGEVVSQKIVGGWLAEHFDHVLTVDAHLHRTKTLKEAVPAKSAVNLTATGPMAAFLAQHFNQPMLVGPDAESRQWVAAIAARDGLDYVVAEKTRLGDREVRISLPEAAYAGRDIVLVDDVASTGKTLLETARQLSKFHPSSLSILVTHALLSDHAVELLRHAGVENIWSCDAIPHATNAVSLAGLLAAHLDFQS